MLGQHLPRGAQPLFSSQILILEVDLSCSLIPMHIIIIILFCTIRDYTGVNCRSVRLWGKASSFWSTYRIGHFVRKEEVAKLHMLSFHYEGEIWKGNSV